MTVADSHSSSRARSDAGQSPAGPNAKPATDVTDLLIMNTLDPGVARSPTETPGTNDLLDAMVQDHLQRAVPDAENAAQDVVETGVEEVAAATVPGTELSEGQRSEMLQREIEMLLAGTPVANAPKEPGTADVTQAELDVLLPQGDKAAVVDAPDEVEEQMSEAEGVLAEELSQLLAETKDAESGVTAAVTTEPPIMTAEPVAAPAVQETAPAPTEQLPSEDININSHTVSEMVQGDSAVVAVRPPGVPEHPIVELADHAHAEVAAEENRGGGIIGDLGLMVGQLFDIPFAWINEIDKNVIGVVAFMLLLGGIVFWIVGWAMGAQ